MKNDTPQLGTIPTEDDDREAVHVAMIPMIAAETLEPGDRVELVSEGAKLCISDFPVGIVDPFLKDEVRRGSRFWLCLFPNTVTGMRHHWEHPAFDSVAAKGVSPAESEKWLRKWISDADCPKYETMMAAIRGESVVNVDPEYYDSAYSIDSEWLHFDGYDAHGNIPPIFWEHVENLLGEAVRFKPSSFSCSC